MFTCKGSSLCTMGLDWLCFPVGITDVKGWLVLSMNLDLPFGQELIIGRIREREVHPIYRVHVRDPSK